MNTQGRSFPRHCRVKAVDQTACGAALFLDTDHPRPHGARLSKGGSMARNRGFTLLTLLAVLAVMALLSAILFPRICQTGSYAAGHNQQAAISDDN